MTRSRPTAAGASPCDLVVIGSSPAGQKGAIAAARLGKRVALVDPGVAGGTSPSHLWREAILRLTRCRPPGPAHAAERRRPMRAVVQSVRVASERERRGLDAQLARHGVTVIDGPARFLAPWTIETTTAAGAVPLTARHVLLACGTRPLHSPSVPLDGQRVYAADQLTAVPELPRHLIVVGAGVVGLEHASILAALGRQVTIVDQRRRVLECMDRDIVDALCFTLRSRGAALRLGETLTAAEVDARGRVVAHLEHGRSISGDGLLYAAGRRVVTDDLNLRAAGLTPDDRGRVPVNERFQTAIPHVYAAGDVAGGPVPASTAMEQGRLAVCHMFGIEARQICPALPYPLYTMPEISTLGPPEEALAAERVPYEIGVAPYAGSLGAPTPGGDLGFLKLLFHRDSLQLLGAHAIGDGAIELIHVAQAVLSLGATIEYFRDTVFSHPSLAEAYKAAALNGLTRLRSAGRPATPSVPSTIEGRAARRARGRSASADPVFERARCYCWSRQDRRRRMAEELQCRVVASREPPSRLWEFTLINDGPTPIESATLEAVRYEWGDQYWGGPSPGVRVGTLAPGEQASIWRDDGDSEMRTDLWLRVTHRGLDTWLLFEFPKLYRQTGTMLVRHGTTVKGPPDP